MSLFPFFSLLNCHLIRYNYDSSKISWNMLRKVKAHHFERIYDRECDLVCNCSGRSHSKLVHLAILHCSQVQEILFLTPQTDSQRTQDQQNSFPLIRSPLFRKALTMTNKSMSKVAWTNVNYLYSLLFSIFAKNNVMYIVRYMLIYILS